MVSVSDTAATLSRRLRHSWSAFIEQLSDSPPAGHRPQRRRSPQVSHPGSVNLERSHQSHFERSYFDHAQAAERTQAANRTQAAARTQAAERTQAAPRTPRRAGPGFATDYAAQLLQLQEQQRSGALTRKNEFAGMMAALSHDMAVGCLITEMREQALDCGLPYQYFLGYGLVLDAQGLWASMGPCLKNLAEVQRSAPAAFEIDSRYPLRSFRSRVEAEPHIRSKLQEFCRQRVVAHAQVQAEPPPCRTHAP
jgi:hypothetical protein